MRLYSLVAGLVATHLIAIASAQEERSISIQSVAFAPDGEHLLVGDSDGRLTLLESKTGRAVREFGLKNPIPVVAIAFTPDAKQAITASANPGVVLPPERPVGEIALWDPFEGRLLHRLDDAKGADYVVVSPDGKQAMTTTKDWGKLKTGDEGILRLWDLTNGRLIRRFTKDAKYARCLAFLMGRHALVKIKNELAILDLEESKLLKRVKVGAIDVKFTTADGAQVVLGRGDDLHLLDVASGKMHTVVRPVGTRLPSDFSGGCQLAELAPDGKGILSGGYNCDLIYLNAQTGEPLKNLANGKSLSLRALSLSRDGRWIASGDEERNVTLWDVSSGRRVWTTRTPTPWSKDPPPLSPERNLRPKQQ